METLLKSEKVEEPEEEGSLYSFFICEEYVERKWSFQFVKEQALLCSKMSTTDHDLTGQIVWPASVILSWFIDQYHELFRNKVILEVGAGCGLGGIVAANFAKSVILTDGNDIVLRLLEKNKAHLQLNHCEVLKLLWGINSEVLKVQSQFGQFPDYVIGADVILWPNQLKSLLYTIRWLLFGRYYEIIQQGVDVSSSETLLPKAFISYVARANTTTDLLHSLVQTLGFQLRTIDNSSFIPSDCRTFDNLTFYMFEIALAPEELKKGCDIAHERQPKLEDQMNSSYLPC